MVEAWEVEGGGSDPGVAGVDGGRRWDFEVGEVAYDAVALIFDRRDDAVGVAGEVPPFVGADAMAVCVGAGSDGGVGRERSSCLA